MQFGVFWIVVFCLYYPAARAGFVTDFTGWLDQVRNHGFLEFINRTHFQARSLYQLTQFNTWICYRLLGTSVWAWHVLFVTLHALNAFLLMTLVRLLLRDAGVAFYNIIAFGGALLFCITPYNSEVIVWEPAFHFLQGLMLILVVLLCVQRLVHTGHRKYALWACLVYGLSLFSLELFYITPWLVLTLALFYAYTPAHGMNIRNRIISLCFAPMMLLFAARFVGYRLLSGDWLSRIGTGSATEFQTNWFGKPAKYLFHLLALGRFWPGDMRHKVYAICDSQMGMLAFYLIVALAFAGIILKFKQMSGKARVAALLFSWLMMSLLLLVPLWFADDMLVLYDRYTYLAGAFFYMLVAVLISMVAMRYAALAIWGLFALANARYAIQVSRYWGKSARIVNSLLTSLPADRSKTMILLNLPQSMHGVPMIGAEKNSEFKLMHNLLIPDKALTNKVYDVLAYNMLTPEDGAHVNVINDSMIKVSLNQWGIWWWFETRGGYSYETADYKLNLIDPGHWYEITLKHPAGEYLVLFNVGAEWKVVDMSRKGPDQQ